MKTQKTIYVLLISLCLITKGLFSQTPDKCDENTFLNKINEEAAKDKRPPESIKLDARLENAKCLKSKEDPKYKSELKDILSKYNKLYEKESKPKLKAHYVKMLAFTYYELEDYANAGKYFKSLTCMNLTNQSEYHFWYGVTYAKQGKCEETLDWLGSYVKMTGDSARVKEYTDKCKGK